MPSGSQLIRQATELNRSFSAHNYSSRDIRKLLNARLTKADIGVIWSDLFNETIDSAIPGRSLNDSIIELLDRVERRQAKEHLLRVLEKDYPHVFRAAPSSTEINSSSGRRRRISCTLDGSLDEFTADKVAALIAFIGTMTDDYSFQIVTLEEGSVRVEMEGTEAGVVRLQDFRAEGLLDEILGHKILEVEFSPDIEDSTNGHSVSPKPSDKSNISAETPQDIHNADSTASEHPVYIGDTRSNTQSARPRAGFLINREYGGWAFLVAAFIMGLLTAFVRDTSWWPISVESTQILFGLSCLIFVALGLIWLPQGLAERINPATPEKRFEIENSAREMITKTLGGLGVLLTLGASVQQLQQTSVTQRLAVETASTDRLYKIIEKLNASEGGKPKGAERLGAIYLMQRILEYSPQDAPFASDTLCAVTLFSM